jgi:phosphatidylglycerophosphatase A
MALGSRSIRWRNIWERGAEMHQVARLIASGLGSGYAPKAPGTVGSLLALLIGAALMQISPLALPAAVAFACVAGYWSIGVAGGAEDPGWVVIDEFAGQWIAMLALARVSLAGLLLAFMLFRLFDIAKPGPVGWADRRHGALGVMLDDVIAGIFAAVIILVVRQFAGAFL